MMIIEQTSKELLSDRDIIIHSVYDNYTIDDIYENSIVDMHESFNSLMEAMTIYELSEKANLIAINESGFIKKFFDGLLNILKKAWDSITSIFSKAKDSLNKKSTATNTKLFELKKREVSLNDTIQITLKNARCKDIYAVDQDIDRYFKNTDEYLKVISTSCIKLIGRISDIDSKVTDYSQLYIEDYPELIDISNASDKFDFMTDDLIREVETFKETVSCRELFKRLSDTDKYIQKLDKAYKQTKSIFISCRRDISNMQRSAMKIKHEDNVQAFIKSVLYSMSKYYNELFKDIITMNTTLSRNINDFHNAYNLAIDYIIKGKDSIVIDFD